jgi:hypothetical protein
VGHLRWDDVDPEQYAEPVLTRARGRRLPTGCLSRRLRQEGNAVLATEVWDDEVAGGRMDDLVTAVHAVGVRQPPQVAMFTVPAGYAVAYRNPSPMPAVPRQPGPPVQEHLPAASHEPRIATV